MACPEALCWGSWRNNQMRAAGREYGRQKWPEGSAAPSEHAFGCLACSTFWPVRAAPRRVLLRRPTWPRAVLPGSQGPSLGGDQGLSAASWSPKYNLKDGGHPERRLQPQPLPSFLTPEKSGDFITKKVKNGPSRIS